MVHILNIHTATETAIINLTADGQTLGKSSNNDTKQHAYFLHIAIKALLRQHNIDIKDLDAIGVSCGPGSYTGIRVGLATAKGLCYALKIPLIIFNSLEVMAFSAIDLVKNDSALYCPMIDARRMEVYVAVYNHNLEEVISPSATILNENSFAEILVHSKIVFSGSGSNKFREIINQANAVFLNEEISAESLTKITWKKYLKNEFGNVPYARPLYIK